MTRATLVICLAAVLGGCSLFDAKTPEPVVVTVPVATPVAVKCVPESVGPKPEYSDTDENLRAAAGLPDRYVQLLQAGRDERNARLSQLEPVVENCRK